MARIAGVEIPSEKRIEISLTYIYGVGRSLSNKILEKAKVNPDLRAKALTEEQVAKIREVMESLNVTVEGELRRVITQNIRRLEDIRCYRGLRHRRRLPVRGQRTRSNARTKRGKRQTVGGMKKILQKT